MTEREQKILSGKKIIRKEIIRKGRERQMKLTRIIALILAASILCIGLVAGAGAESSYYDEQVKKFEAMKNKKIGVWIDNGGMYSRKTQKFWARKVIGLAYDGGFQLGPWECFDNCSDNFVLPGTYVMFGYSVDITWGTDWPYSGCFRTFKEIEGPLVDLIRIQLWGLCRSVGIKISINNETVYYNEDCDAHNEWVPR